MRSRAERLFQLAVVLLLAFATSGCFTSRYIEQAAAGQNRLNGRGMDIEEIVQHEYLDKRRRDLLAQVPAIKAFGERHGLKHTKNYERYLYVGNVAVVWVVSACDPVRFRPKAWRFPITGSITYTGWFDRKEAVEYAMKLSKGGWDVDVRPSPAYSTLGWFDDPVLSTMIAPGDEALGELADVILHETLHATYYVPGQSTLNESVASFIGDTLAVRYMDETLGPDSKQKAKFLAGRARGEARAKRMKAAYAELVDLYASELTKDEKLARKKEIIDRLQLDVMARRPINNASLIQFKTYGSGKEEMQQLLELCGGDMPRLIRTLERLRPIARDAKPHSDPATLLRPVVAQGCAP
ncbi:MAG: aminopeptidase [Deltaproteobacteria bacterium]|nr:aminopeptidase [Deltaproteobacteria bacterium]